MSRVRQLFPHSRLFFRISPPFRQDSYSSSVRHVKFKRPWFRKFVSSCLLYGVAFHLWGSFVLLRFDDTLHDVDNPQQSILEESGPNDNKKLARSLPNGHNQDISEESTPTFIPLGWPRLREGNFYAVSDPEWQEFIKVSRNREQLQLLKDELASAVLKDASKSSLLSQMLGGPLAVTGFWLVHHFPSRAPPEYCRSGVEISDNGMSWVSRAMSAEDGERLQRCIRPIFVVHAIRDAYMVFWRSLLLKFNISNTDEEQASSISKLLYQAESSGLKSLRGLGDISQVEQQLPSPNNAQKHTPQHNDDLRHHPSFFISTLQKLPLPKLGPGSNLYAASLAFKLRLQECWSRELGIPRRGTFYFVGPVGLRGPKGFCRIEVKGEYDPAASKWVHISMQLKDLSIFNQKALG